MRVGLASTLGTLALGAARLIELAARRGISLIRPEPRTLDEGPAAGAEAVGIAAEREPWRRVAPRGEGRVIEEQPELALDRGSGASGNGAGPSSADGAAERSVTADAVPAEVAGSSPTDPEPVEAAAPSAGRESRAQPDEAEPASTAARVEPERSVPRAAADSPPEDPGSTDLGPPRHPALEAHIAPAGDPLPRASADVRRPYVPSTVAEDRGPDAEPPPELADPPLYFNRELSWVDFNDRVLQLAEDERIPLLERAKFAAIYEDNLDEFFMVRMAGLHDQIEAGVDARGADGLSATEQIDAVRERVIELRARLERCFEDELKPALDDHGIRLIAVGSASAEEREELGEVFRKQIFPSLTPLVIGLGRPFPYISNVSLSIAVVLHDPEQAERVIARVKVPKELLGRFVPLGDSTTFVALEDAIIANLEVLFPGMDVVDHALFRVTRDTDYDVSDEADDLRQAIEDELRRRRFGEVVRLEVSERMDQRLREHLVGALGIEERQLYEIGGMLGMDDLWDVVGISGFDELRYPPFLGVTQPRLQGEDGESADVMAAMRERDLLVHHPYDAFGTSVEAFIKQAVADPDVLAIKQTVYRTSADSPLVPSLIHASEAGKQAVCMVELKARFDERANLDWAKKLEESGVHVVYGIPHLKTHCKCILVVRREGDGVRHYVHVGTGNYNPKTARLYTDFGLFTVDPVLGTDIGEMFNYLTGYARPRGYRRALIAPVNLQRRLLEEVERTVEAHSPEHPARIRMKMNSLLDAPAIRALYEASRAGVKVELNVRGICALRPGVPGVSENIEVVSVVGRFLEHSRIYAFERRGETRVFIGSADLMPRNLYHRVELVVPVEDERVRAELLETLDLCLSDNVHAWTLGEDGAWTRRSPAPGEPVRDAQQQLIDRNVARAAEPATT